MKKTCITLAVVTLLTILPTWSFAQEYEQPTGQAAEPPGPPPPDPTVLRKLRIRFESEPTVKEVQEWALNFFKVHPEMVNGYRNGATWKALVPDVEIAFNTEKGNSDRRLVDMLYVNPTTYTRFNDGKDFEYTNNTGQYLTVRAHWTFDRLIFNAEVLDVTSLVGIQESILREITSLYYTRKRLMTILALNPPQDAGEKITEAIRLDEITANLNALTGGVFSREVQKRTGKKD